MFLVDTNYVSELTKPAPAPAVIAWSVTQSILRLHLSAVTLGELETGVASLPPGPRRMRIEQWLAHEVPRQFERRVLPFDADVARTWGRLVVATRAARNEPSAIDGLLLATAAHHRLTFVTRNVRHCAGRGVPVFDPWTGTLHPPELTL